ncbi:MAG: type 4a pilus biogenesis protein PilO [Zoogloeaceae bacterium]|jgi:type IV pilus assembly protein PilO|nr:type 4a pilus biogenesis protein PilO [Zoogloeaceae bacterium]
MSAEKVSLQEQFRSLNNPDRGTWDIAPKIMLLVLAFIGVIVLGYFLLWSDQQDSLSLAKQEEDSLRDEFQTKKARAINLDLYRAQRDEMSKSFAALLKQLPDKTEVKELLVEVNQAGLGRGLLFSLFRPGDEIKKEFYALLPVEVRLNGVYHDIGAFASDIAKLPRIVTINNLAITTTPIGLRLDTGMEIRTFRYLSDEELSGQGGNK